MRGLRLAAAWLGLYVTNSVQAADATLIARGQVAYSHRCSMCHAAGQTGTYILSRRLGADKSLLEKRMDLLPTYIRFTVRNGLVNMPRISRVEMPEADLDAVVAYLTASNSKQ
jgi:mono/diheme cytochrome c family protein